MKIFEIWYNKIKMLEYISDINNSCKILRTGDKMRRNILVLPNQLFAKVKEMEIDNLIIYEAKKYFTDYKYNQKKLLLHRASMKNFQQEVEAEFGEELVKYYEYKVSLEEVIKDLESLRLFDPINKELKAEIRGIAERYEVDLEILESPNFLTSRLKNKEYFAENKFFQHQYYQMQRKRLGILVNEDNKPVGGKWSFDSKNRKKFPKDIEIPKLPDFKNSFLDEAKSYVTANFADNPGNLDDFVYPVNRVEAEKLLADFLENKLEKFGEYQDGFEKEIVFGFHSLISSSLNIGLLDPAEVVAEVLDYYHENKDKLPLSSVEGFIRQVIGWREYVRALYDLEYENMIESDYFGHDRELQNSFYLGETGIEPVDDSIKKAVDYGYCHHIERLMVLGNFFLLNELDKDQVFDWFMELFIDAYEWVMAANIYGMSQYSYPEMMTKPYISSSNYILKMSHYRQGDWGVIWDGLYWRFIDKNRDKFSSNSRMGLMLSILDRMSSDKLEKHKAVADEYLKKLADLENGPVT